MKGSSQNLRLTDAFLSIPQSTSKASKSQTPINRVSPLIQHNPHKVTKFVYQHSFPNKVHVQMSQISNGSIPCITSKHIMSFDLNPITKEVFLVTDNELAIFDIDKNQFRSARTFKQILSYQIQVNPTLQSLGEVKMTSDSKSKTINANGSNAGSSKPGTAQPLNPTVSSQQNSFMRPVSLKLYNYWIIIKNNKQVLFCDSDLNFSKETISDSNGIQDYAISQKSEEIITLTKDLRQIRIWTYMIYKKDRPMPPIDELPVNVNYVDSNLHVFVTNKKNIHVNMNVDKLCLINISDILMLSSSESNSLALFTTKEGKNLYSLDYQTLLISDQNQVSSSLTKIKYSHEQGFFSKIPDSQQKAWLMLKQHQEFVYIMNRRNFDLLVWDIALEKVLYALNLNQICQCPQNSIDFIYPSLSNFKTGFIVIDDAFNIYDISLKQKQVIHKYQHSKNLHQNRAESIKQETFSSEVRNYRRKSINIKPQKSAKGQLEEVKSGFTPENNIRQREEAFFQRPDSTSKNRNQQQSNGKTPKRNKNGGQSQLALPRPYIIRYLSNQDGSKTLFVSKQDSLQIDVITLYSNIDFCIELKNLQLKTNLSAHKDLDFTYQSLVCKNTLPLIDHSNNYYVLDIYGDKFNQPPKVLMQINMSDMTYGHHKQVLEIGALSEKHKKELFNSLQNQKHFTYCLKSRLAVFIDSQGLCCVVNTHYRTRKFIYLEDRMKIKEVFIMVAQQQSNPYYIQLMNKQPSDEEFTRRDNPFRYLDDYPDFDYKIGVITHDGLILIVQNETQFNEIRVSNRINTQTPVLQCRYIPEKQKIIVIYREAQMKVYDVSKEVIEVIKTCQLMWPDITAIDMRSDEVLVAGHSSGIIYTQSLKGEVKITEMQLHNYHLVPITQISLPQLPNSHNQKRFIALAQNMILTLFSMEEDRPLKIMSYADQSFSKVVYMGRNEVLAFDNKYIYKIDLNDAQVFQENFKKQKEDWLMISTQRLLKNQFTKKQVQVEEQRNDQFYSFQAYKNSINLKNGDQYEPELYRYYLSLNNHMNIYSSLLQQEIDYMLSQSIYKMEEKESHFPIKQHVFLKDIQSFLFDQKQQQVDVINQDGTLMPYSIKKQSNNKSRKQLQDQEQPLEKLDFQRKMRDMNKLNKRYRMSVVLSQVNIQEIQKLQLENTQEKSIKNQKSSIGLTQNKSIDKTNSKEFLSPIKGSNLSAHKKESINLIINESFQEDTGHSVIFETHNEEDSHLKITKKSTQLNQFLNVFNQGEQEKVTKNIDKNINKGIENPYLLDFMHKRNTSNLSVKNSLGIGSLTQLKKVPFFQRLGTAGPTLLKSTLKKSTSQIEIIPQQNQHIKFDNKQNKQHPQKKSQNTLYYQLPSISMEGYTQELFAMRQKIQSMEERAQTAANQRLSLKGDKGLLGSQGIQSSYWNLISKMQGNKEESQKSVITNDNKYSVTTKPFTQDGNREKTLQYSQSESNFAIDQKNLRSRIQTQSSLFLLSPSNQQIELEQQIKQHQQIPQKKQSFQYLNDQIQLDLLPQSHPSTSQVKKRQVLSKVQSQPRLSHMSENQISCTAASLSTSNALVQKMNFQNVGLPDYLEQYFKPVIQDQRNKRSPEAGKSKMFNTKSISTERKGVDINIEEVDKDEIDEKKLQLLNQNNQMTSGYVQKVVLKPKEHHINIKDKTNQQVSPNLTKPQFSQQLILKPEQTQLEKDYDSMLKRLLMRDKTQKQQRINIMEKKPEVQGKDKIKLLPGIEDEAIKNKLDLNQDTFSESDSESDENKLLGEEERSLIVDEILKANGDLIFEDNSPENDPILDNLTAGETSVNIDSTKQQIDSSKETHHKKLRVIVKSSGKEQKEKALQEAKKIQQMNLLMSKHQRNDKTVFEQGFLSAHKMQIVKHSKKERQGVKYTLMKELLRDKVTISKEDQGFQIIIPKSLHYGKANLKNIEVDEFVKNYYVFRLNYKDILQLIREQLKLEGDDEQVMITKEQVALFLKKHLSKLLVEQDPDQLRKNSRFQEQMSKLEDVKKRKIHRERDKLLRQLHKEEELQQKREKAHMERLSQDDIKKAKEQLLEEKRRRIKMKQQQLFKVVQPEDDSASGDDQKVIKSGTHNYVYKHRNSVRGGMPQGFGDADMIYATELKIAVRQDDVKRRLEQLKLEKEQDRVRVEKMQMYNYIRDFIVNGLIINRKVGAYIRQKENGSLDLDTYLKSFNDNQEQVQEAGQKTSGASNNGYGSFAGDRKARMQMYNDQLKKKNKKPSNNRKSTSQASMGDHIEGQSVKTFQKMGAKLTKNQSKDQVPEIFVHSNDTQNQDSLQEIQNIIGQTNIQITPMDDGSGQSMHHLNIIQQVSSSSKKNTRNSFQGSGGSSRFPSSNYNNNSNTSPGSKRRHTAQVQNLQAFHSSSDKLTPAGNKQSDIEEYGEESGDSQRASTGKKPLPKRSMQSRSGRSPKKGEQNNINEESFDEYYEEEPNDFVDEKDFTLSKNPSSLSNPNSRQSQMRKIRRIKLISDNNKIKDYNLDIQSQSSYDVNMQSQTNLVTSQMGGGHTADLYSVLDSDQEDQMTKEEEIQRINLELQYQRILEKITEKMMSRKISQFKKELLIRIALNLELMSAPDLTSLEDLLEKYESHDSEVKRLIIELFQEKYQIDLGTNLQTLVEEQMNKVKDDAKAVRRKNIKELLLKKIRMLNMISRFCKVGPNQDPFLAAQSAQKRLKDLLDADDEEFYSDDEDGNFNKEFQETVQEVLTRIFQNEDKSLAVALSNFKKNYKNKFSVQAEFNVKDDAESELQNNKDAIARMRVQAFVFNGQRLLDVLQNWLHPQEYVVESDIGGSLESKEQRRRKALYDPNADLNEENMSEQLGDLMQEMLKRLAAVQNAIKANQKILDHNAINNNSEQDQDHNLFDSSLFEMSEGGSLHKKLKHKQQLYKIDLDALNQRRALSEQELAERQYCALRIAEYIETNMLQAYQEMYYGEDEQQYAKTIHSHNFLDPEVPRRILDRETIAHLREAQPGYQDPLIKTMQEVFSKFNKMI